MIVVLDTNVVVSGIFFRGPPASILEAWFEHEWEEIVVEKCHLIPDAESRVILSRDPSDAKFLDCAIRSGADYLVTGDLDLRSFKGDLRFKVVSPRQFVQLL